MITVSKVLHGLELLIDDTNAGLVCAVYDAFNVFGALAHCLQLLVQALGSFNCGLGVELGLGGVSMQYSIGIQTRV